MKTNNKAVEIQDEEELKILLESAERSSAKAIRESKALGLTMKFIINNEIVERLPNGEERVLRKINTTSTNCTGLKKGAVLCKKK